MTTTKARRIGFQGRYAKSLPAEQLAAAIAAADLCETDLGASRIELRPVSYCGPDSLGAQGAAAVIADGRIFTDVLPDGRRCF